MQMGGGDPALKDSQRIFQCPVLYLCLQMFRVPSISEPFQDSVSGVGLFLGVLGSQLCPLHRSGFSPFSGLFWQSSLDCSQVAKLSDIFPLWLVPLLLSLFPWVYVFKNS